MDDVAFVEDDDWAFEMPRINGMGSSGIDREGGEAFADAVGICDTPDLERTVRFGRAGWVVDEFGGVEGYVPSSPVRLARF